MNQNIFLKTLQIKHITMAKKQTTKGEKNNTPKIEHKNKSNKLFYGDNLEVLRKYIKDESVDFCYIDPPFNSNREYNQIYLNQGKEDKAQAHAFTDTWEWDDIALKGYNEIIANEHNRFNTKTIILIESLNKVLGRDSLLSYLIHITLRVTEIQRVLKPTGSFYLHCDPTASHYLKLVIDGIFIENGGDFLNEIIWHYRRWTNAQNQFQSMHDVIFFYAKTKSENKFNFTEVDMSESQSKKFERGWDSNVIHTKDSKYSQLIVYNEKKFNDAVKAGKMNKGKYKNIIIRNSPHVAASDVIIMPTLNSQAKERLGYPTQKPEALLEKLILSSTDKGDVVLDVYCGCGTTVSVAQKLSRTWIGVDITYQSISLILKRLEESYGKKILEKIELNGVPQDWESAKALAEKDEDKVRKEFEKWAVLFYSNNRAKINEKKGGDGGIDGIALIQERNKNADIETKKIVFSVKSDKTLVPAYVNQLKGKMHDDDVVMGVLLCLYEPTKGMLKEAKEMGIYKNELFNLEFPKLQIISVRDMFDKEARLNIPVMDMVKKAELKENTKDQIKLFNED